MPPVSTEQWPCDIAAPNNHLLLRKTLYSALVKCSYFISIIILYVFRIILVDFTSSVIFIDFTCIVIFIDFTCSVMRCTTNRKVAGSIPAGVSGFFIDIISFRSHYGSGVDSASNKNEYQEYFLGVKAAGA